MIQSWANQSATPPDISLEGESICSSPDKGRLGGVGVQLRPAFPILIIAIGNESRGDDALAPQLVRQIQCENFGQVEFIEEYQLQVEHVTDLVGRSAVLFIDADASCDAPFLFSSITAAHDNSYTSHAMSPAALLHAYSQVYEKDAPPAFLLRIRGYGFELGESLSDAASANLESATKLVRKLCAATSLPIWREYLVNA